MNQDKINIFKRHVDSYFSGKLIIKSGFSPLDISNGINWDYKAKKNSNTYQTYLHSLNFIDPLLQIAKIDGDSRLFKEIRDVIIDWYESNKNNDANHAWQEHPTSYRIENIINFQKENQKYKLNNSVFDELIRIHCEYLNDESNYKMNNHGLMMDKALLNASSYIEDNNLKKTYEEKAMYRIRFSMFRDFTRRGVHLENSPEYHRVVLILYRQILETLKTAKISIDNNFKMLYSAANDFKSLLIMPNMEYPMVGDTGKISEPNIPKKFGDFIDYDAGLAIFQNRNNSDFSKSSYLLFNCGYQSKTHKHLDDLSLVYYVDGHELLIDPGKYSYDKNDKIRKYLISPSAHSSVSIRNKNYKLNNSFQDSSKLKITRNFSNSDYKLVSGINKMYEGSRISRTVIKTKSPVILIIDRVLNNETEKVIQTFNLNEKAVIKKLTNEEYTVQLNENEYGIKTYKIRSTEIKSTIEEGYVSYKFSDYSKNERLIFEQESKSATFLTIINNKNVQVNEVKFTNNNLSFNCDEELYSIDI